MNAQPTEILLVEDNPDDVELTLRALSTHNLANRVKVVSDGAEALDYLRPDDGEHPPADGYPKLVLLDLKLPRVGGLEVLERLRADPRVETAGDIGALEQEDVRQWREGPFDKHVEAVEGSAAAVIEAAAVRRVGAPRCAGIGQPAQPRVEAAL